MTFTISKDGLAEHYKHVQRIRQEHGKKPFFAVREIGNRTVKEAKMLANKRVMRRSGRYEGSIHLSEMKQGKQEQAIIGSYMAYAPAIETGIQNPVMIFPKNGKVLAWKSNRIWNIKTKKERTTKVKSHVTKSGEQEYEFMVFSKWAMQKRRPGKWILRDAIFNIAKEHIPIIMKYLQKPVK